MYDADPKLLLEREYDKVIHTTRELTSLCKAIVECFAVFTIEDCIKLILERPNFFSNIKKKHDKLNKEIEDPRFLRISLEDWNNFTTQTFDLLLDFLEFPKENRLKLAPVHVDRNFGAYSCSHLPKETKVCDYLEVIREHG